MNPSDADGIETLLTDDGWLRPLVAHLVDEHELEDLMQDTKVAALTAPPADSPRAWLSVVARNLALRVRRAKLRRQRREQLAAKPERVLSTDELAERVDAQRRVAQAVLHLQEPCRSAVLLRYHEGLHASEIGARLGVPAATVRTRLRRGIAQIRAELEGDLGSDWRGSCGLLLLTPRNGAVVAAGSGLLTGILLIMTLPKFIVPTVVVAAAASLFLLRGGGSPPAPPSSAAPPPRPAESTAAALSERESAAAAARSGITAREVVESDLEPSVGLNGAVFDERGKPLSGVPVALAERSWRVGIDADILGETDAAGRFALTAPSRAGALIVGSDDYVTLHAFPVNGDPVEAVVIVAVPAVTVSGRVFGPGGEPIEGVGVEVGYHASATFPTALDRTELAQFGKIRSAADGRFELERVPATTAARIGFYADGRKAASRPCPLVSVDDLDVVLHDLRASEPELVGIVVDQTGRLIRGARVQLGDVTRLSDDYGEFVIPVREEGSTLCAARPGYVPAVVEGVGADHVERHGPVDPIVLTLVAGELAITGEVSRRRGEPVAGLFVTVLDPTHLELGKTVEEFGRESEFDGERDAVTDAAGTFRIGGLHARDYVLRVYDPGTLRNLTTAPVRPGGAPVSLRWADAVVHRDVTSRVVTRAGRPVAGASVSVSMVLRRYHVVTQATSAASVITDDRGRFGFDELPASGALLAVSGDDVIATEFEIREPAALHRLVVPVRCHVQIVVGDRPDFTRVRFEDESGRVVKVRGITTGMQWILASWASKDGDSPVLAVSDAATHVAFLDGDREVRRTAVTLIPGEVVTVR